MLVLTKRMNGVGPSDTSIFPAVRPASAAMKSPHRSAVTGIINRDFMSAFLLESTRKVKLIQK
jgi:hypothetical protein